MLRRLTMAILLLILSLGASAATAQDGGDSAFLRVVQLVNDGAAVSMTMTDGRPVLVNFTPGSISDYFPYVAYRSAAATFIVAPSGGAAYTRTWTLPPLAPGYHTAALVGGGGDNTLDLIVLDEDRLCADSGADDSCVILINNVRNSPPLTLNLDGRGVIGGVSYRQAAAASAPAGGYRQLTVVDPAAPQTPFLRIEQGYFAPNLISLIAMSGGYSGGQPVNMRVGLPRRVPTDIITFLRGLTADVQVTDGETLYAAENILALIEMARFETLFGNPNFPLTVFAPTDGAVLSVAPEVFECAMSSTEAMRALIFHHISVGTYTPAQLSAEGSLPTLAGTTHTFRAAPGGFVIDGTVAVTDAEHYMTLSGSLYLIDTVLIPPDFEQRYCTLG
ncbi:MAG: fasciclin domain-containing protein [Anaerolineae bacterium]|nr:fasciclin domain-containing protein [Anaerolineae bacterium]